MSTYINGFECLRQVRLSIDEFDPDIAQGVNTNNAFSNDYIMQKINNAQRYIYSLVFDNASEMFITSITASFSSSSYTLPADFNSISELRDENGYKVYHIKLKDSTPSISTGSDSYYYRQGVNTLKLDKTGVTKDYIMYYYTKPRDLYQGRVTATGTGTMTLNGSKQIVDYYNNVLVENSNDDTNSTDWVDVITDYTTARVVSISETALVDDIVGTVSELPEPFHFLIPLKATLDIKAEHPLAKSKPTAQEFKNFDDQLKQALVLTAGMDKDITVRDIFTDYGPINSQRSVLVSN